MTKEQIIKKILKYHWRPWLERPVGAFWLSMGKGAFARKAMREIGIDIELECGIYERGGWYDSEEVWKKCEKGVEKFLFSGGTVAKILAGAEVFYKNKKKEIDEMLNSQTDDFLKLKKIQKILQISYTYIWVTFCLERVYNKILRREVPKNMKGSVEKNISEISFPKKKNAHSFMVEAIMRGDDLKSVVKKFGWIKVRDIFSSPFTVSELKKEKEEIISAYKKIKIPKVKIPKPLVFLAAEVQELVYFRTFRTDMIGEFTFLARPLFKKIAKHFGLKFSDLKDYCIYDLSVGKLIKRQPNLVAYKDEMFFSDKPVLPEDIIKNREVRGQIAYKGIVRGTVKIIKKAHETDKVKDGDILVTQMTFPSYILAMKRAAAFVTDEGGITCHAAIIAREMKKPCIIGTKNATKILHDGDLVEVDANKGIVKIIK